jgi:hypothetical protein
MVQVCFSVAYPHAGIDTVSCRQERFLSEKCRSSPEKKDWGPCLIDWFLLFVCARPRHAESLSLSLSLSNKICELTNATALINCKKEWLEADVEKNIFIVALSLIRRKDKVYFLHATGGSRFLTAEY